MNRCFLRNKGQIKPSNLVPHPHHKVEKGQPFHAKKKDGKKGWGGAQNRCTVERRREKMGERCHSIGTIFVRGGGKGETVQSFYRGETALVNPQILLGQRTQRFSPSHKLSLQNSPNQKHSS